MRADGLAHAQWDSAHGIAPWGSSWRGYLAGVNLGTAGVLTPELSSPVLCIPPGFSCNSYLNGNPAVVEYSGTIC